MLLLLLWVFLGVDANSRVQLWLRTPRSCGGVCQAFPHPSSLASPAKFRQGARMHRSCQKNNLKVQELEKA